MKKLTPKKMQYLSLFLFMDSVGKQYTDELKQGITSKDDFLEVFNVISHRKITTIEFTTYQTELNKVFVITKQAVQNHKNRKNAEREAGNESKVLVYHSDIIKMCLNLMSQSTIDKEFPQLKGKYEDLSNIPSEVYLELLLIFNEISTKCDAPLIVDSMFSKPKLKKPAKEAKSKSVSCKPKKLIKVKKVKLSQVKSIVKKKGLKFISGDSSTFVVEYKDYECTVKPEGNIGSLLSDFINQVDLLDTDNVLDE